MIVTNSTSDAFPLPQLATLMAQWPGALRLSESCTLAEAVSRLDAAPDAPGLMVERGGRPPLPISRSAVTSGITQMLTVSGASRTPLAGFVNQWATPLLELPSSTLLGDAVRAAVSRDAAARFEPILITDPDGPTLMVDLGILLLAQCSALEGAVGAISAAKVAAEDAAAVRTRFLVGLGHEIRTPMTAIVGFAEYLAGNSLSSAERAEHGAAIRRNADHLLAVINDLLDASKFESGKMTVERIACDPLQCIDVAMDILRPAAINRGLIFTRTVRGGIPPVIYADPLRLRQILLNLLSNAIKFTDHGSVTVEVSGDSSVLAPALRISVIDTGPGMTSLQCREVFAGFSQADQSISRRFGGSGLGLSISRLFAQLMGGRLTCESIPGRGSTFTLTINTRTCSESAQQSPLVTVHGDDTDSTQHTLNGLRILLAEDGPDNQRLLHTHLARAGAEVILASDGFAAVQAAMAPEFGAPPIDVILMDHEMPVMDGLQATRVLRSRHYTGPIIALTAHDSEEHRKRCLQEGCDDYLVKPIDRHKLIQTAARWAIRAVRPIRRTDAA